MIQQMNDSILLYSLQICRKFLHSLDTSAREREKAAMVMQALISNNLSRDIDFHKLLQDLIKLMKTPNVTATGMSSKQTCTHFSFDCHLHNFSLLIFMFVVICSAATIV